MCLKDTNLVAGHKPSYNPFSKSLCLSDTNLVARESLINNQLSESVGSNDTNKNVNVSEQNESASSDKAALMATNFVRMQKDFMAIQNFFDFLCRIGKIAAKDYE